MNWILTFIGIRPGYGGGYGGYGNGIGGYGGYGNGYGGSVGGYGGNVRYGDITVQLSSVNTGTFFPLKGSGNIFATYILRPPSQSMETTFIPW